MSKSPGSRDLTETFQDILTNVARVVFYLGAVSTLVGVGLLVFLCFRVTGDNNLAADALRNVGILRQVVTFGALGLAVGSSYLFWGEELIGAIQLMVAAVLFFAPAFLPSLLGGTTNEVVGAALSAIQFAGMLLGSVALVVLVIDVAGRVRQRAKVGIKADQLKYGKGIKEEADRQNVFLGKCWQLPFCRKFVREKCPIYHAKRTCWREQVGCMCEEEVIRTAMGDKVVSKEALLSGAAIPRNAKLTSKQKSERCKNCVIYNEHQRHKYRAVVPAILVTIGVFYIGLHGPMAALMEGLLQTVNRAVRTVTMTGTKTFEAPVFFVEGLLFFAMMLLLTYALKLAEYLVFKLKI